MPVLTACDSYEPGSASQPHIRDLLPCSPSLDTTTTILRKGRLLNIKERSPTLAFLGFDSPPEPWKWSAVLKGRAQISRK